jgi:hypothetical protein
LLGLKKVEERRAAMSFKSEIASPRTLYVLTSDLSCLEGRTSQSLGWSMTEPGLGEIALFYYCPETDRLYNDGEFRDKVLEHLVREISQHPGLERVRVVVHKFHRDLRQTQKNCEFVHLQFALAADLRKKLTGLDRNLSVTLVVGGFAIPQTVKLLKQDARFRKMLQGIRVVPLIPRKDHSKPEWRR